MEINTTTKVSRAVYYRCLWLVRDCKRLQELVDISRSDPSESKCACSETGITIDQATIERAEYELECIERALDAVPDVYRQGILQNITDKQPFSDLAHPNTWKKWKQLFIYELAKQLHLI